MRMLLIAAAALAGIAAAPAEAQPGYGYRDGYFHHYNCNRWASAYRRNACRSGYGYGPRWRGGYGRDRYYGRHYYRGRPAYHRGWR